MDDVDPSALLDALPDPVLVIGTDVRLRWGNQAAVDRFGWTHEELIGRDVAPLVHRDDFVRALASLQSVQHKTLGTPVTIRLRDRSGRFSSFEVRGRSAVHDPRVGGVVLVLRDVSERRRWDVDGGDAQVFQAILDHAPGITMLLSPSGALRGASRAYSAILGRDLESSLGVPLWELAAPGDVEVVRRELRRVAARHDVATFEAGFERSDQRDPVPLSLTAVNLVDDRSVGGIVVTAVDITALAEARERLHHNANHDPLTGLVNRGYLRDRLAIAVANARRDATPLSVLFCDIDGFKAVNDRFGHRVGDEVLVQVARRLEGSMRTSDVVGRYGGDEFVIILENTDEHAVEAARDRVCDVLAEPVFVEDGTEMPVRGSVGIAVDDGSGGLDELLARADAAMYRSKARRR